ncbi:hypothetical protein RvY_12844 [Ramazzottius varieornatus]|uniref:Peptidase S1 domain-containing protein n=1 Tax=Ramazzottius varieornatus TaxID=947166 RepID=A0A1D1VPZ5_RAMVA|nr:hypothetical protein RvY_12844 [Ramazzottius varieornatus]
MSRFLIFAVCCFSGRFFRWITRCSVKRPRNTKTISARPDDYFYCSISPFLITVDSSHFWLLEPFDVLTMLKLLLVSLYVAVQLATGIDGLLPQFLELRANLLEARQFGGFGRPNFNGRPNNFNQFNNNNNNNFGRPPPPPPQQQRPPSQQSGDPRGPANVFTLSADRFPLEDELNVPTDRLPGVSSGNVIIPSGNAAVNTNKINVDESGIVPADAKTCVSTKNDQTSNGFCSNVFDVVIKRRCSNFRTLKSSDCQDSEVCCFKLSADDHIDTPFDQVPCGLRRTPELAQRELQRIADEENFDTVPMRILGGLEAFQTEICWQVAIMVDGKYVCGGAAINSRFVVTAGHCLNDVENLKQVTVITGTSDLKKPGRCTETFQVSDVIFNDNYDPRTLVFDFAVIKLSSPITNSNCTCRVCIPDTSKPLENPEASGTLECIVTGYGTTEAGKSPADVGPLNIGRVSVIPESTADPKCSNRMHTSSMIPSTFFVDDSMLCAIGEDPNKITDTCDLDGGSPLACKLHSEAEVYTLVGLSSWGLPCGSNVVRNSADQEVRIPTVYSRVRSVAKWIEDKTRL